MAASQQGRFSLVKPSTFYPYLIRLFFLFQTLPFASQIDILTAIKDFKKGIYEAQWQVAKLGMDEEDLTEQIKQFQLLRVTKQLQTVIKNGEDISSANEVAALENRYDRSGRSRFSQCLLSIRRAASN